MCDRQLFAGRLADVGQRRKPVAAAVGSRPTIPRLAPAELKTLSFSGLELRVLTISDEPWFVAADVIKAIYGPTNSNSMPYNILSPDERSYTNRIDVGLAPGRKMVSISKSGLYKLIARSDKPEARKFQDWVTRDVFPLPPSRTDRPSPIAGTWLPSSARNIATFSNPSTDWNVVQVSLR
ncbi:BRO family protein [Pelagibacterium nitratireducens]|uniref:BRO family protein n=1 Tax=Pelagibacterium nitratireducens TaxID=1046114 RepID=A0ABZ2I3Z8_9HYPH